MLRMSCRFDRQQLASVFSRPQTIGLVFRNPFNQGVSGRVRLMLPEDWGDPLELPFEAASEDEVVSPFRILLDSDASSGRKPVRIDFEINADQNYRFSVYRWLEIGLGDIALEHIVRTGNQGEIIVEQHLINKSDDFISFNCYLFAPGRRRMRQQVIGLGHGRVKIEFILPDGEELLGQTLRLQAEEIGGERVLNQRIVVE